MVGGNLKAELISDMKICEYIDKCMCVFMYLMFILPYNDY